ncbi:hypothetical protein GCM10023237_52870 [Streptomyces coeruleoprunus]
MKFMAFNIPETGQKNAGTCRPEKARYSFRIIRPAIFVTPCRDKHPCAPAAPYGKKTRARHS